MFPKDIIVTSALISECQINKELIISNWHSGARIVKQRNPHHHNIEYLLVEQFPKSNMINMKVRISRDDAISLIEKLQLSATNSHSEVSTTIYKK